MFSGKLIIGSLGLVLLASMVLGGSGWLTLAQHPSAQTTLQAESRPPQTPESQQQPSPSSTPATGSHAAHEMEQKTLLELAFAAF